MGKKHSLLKDMFNFSIGEIWVKILAVISVPIIASLLSVEEFGKAETASSIINILTIVCVMGVDSALKRYYYEKDAEYESFIKFSLQSYGLISLIVIILLLLSNIFLPLFGHFTFGIGLLNITIIASLLAGIKTIYTADLLVRRKTISISLIKVVESTAAVLLSVILLKYVRATGEMRIFAGLVVSLPIFFFVVIKLVKSGRNAGKKIQYRKFIKYTTVCGLPIMINQISGFILNFIDRFMIIAFYSFTETGLYSFAYKIGMVITVLITIVSKPFFPEIFQSLKEDKKERVKKLVVEFSGYGIELTAVIILLYKELVQFIVPHSYQSTTYVVYFIFLGYLFRYLYIFYTHIESYYKKTKVVPIVSAGGAILNIILNLILMNFYGYEVAAVTTLISFAVIYFAHYFYCKIKLSYDIRGIDKKGLMFLLLAIIPPIMEYLNVPTIVLLISKGIILVIMLVLSRMFKLLINIVKNK